MKDLVSQILKFFDNTSEYIKILKAGLSGYETFIKELKGDVNDESK